MPPSPDQSDHPAALPVGIIGAGFSGTLLAIHLLRMGARVVLIERDEPSLAKGLAYGTRRPEHVLNVRAANMSAYPDDPGHFLRWMGFGDGEQAHRFVPRLAYGQYLREQLVTALAAAGSRATVIAREAIGIDRAECGATVRLADGKSIAVRAAVLALGNFAPATPPVLANLSPEVLVSDPWRLPPADSDPADHVLLLGTGLTAVDVALALDGMGYRGKMTALSRRGLRPRVHDAVVVPVGAVARPTPRGAALVRHVRHRARHVDWRVAIDELRPHTQSLWRLHDEAAQRRFLRHLQPFWDVHRHRLAPAVAERVTALEQSGRLRFVGGRIISATPDERGAAIRWRPRHGEATEMLAVNRVINCTGPQQDITSLPSELLQRLLAKGQIRPDLHRLGIEVDHLGRAVDRWGQRQDTLFAVGPLTKGEAWEIVAVPDIRRQVWELARFLTSTHWVAVGL